MARDLIGFVLGTETRTIYAVISPDDDADLDNPRHLELDNVCGVPVRMVKVSRADYGYQGEMSPDDVCDLMVRWYVEAAP